MGIVRVSSAEFEFSPAFDGENQVNSHYIAVLKGFIHPLAAGPNGTAIKLYLTTLAARALLYVSTTDDPLLKVIPLVVIPQCR